MKPTDVLKEEHQHIQKVLGALRIAVSRGRAGQRLDPDWFGCAARFLRVFVDEYHRLKENEVLSRALERYGFLRDEPGLLCIFEEYLHCRTYALGIGELAAAVKVGAASRVPEMLEAASAYADLLDAHIRMEEQVIHPYAERLPPGGVRGDPDLLRKAGDGNATDFAAAANGLAREMVVQAQTSCPPAPAHAPRPRQRMPPARG